MACSLRAGSLVGVRGSPRACRLPPPKFSSNSFPELAQVGRLAGPMACQMLHRVACITNASNLVIVDTTAAPALYVVGQ